MSTVWTAGLHALSRVTSYVKVCDIVSSLTLVSCWQYLGLTLGFTWVCVCQEMFANYAYGYVQLYLEQCCNHIPYP